MSQPTPIQQKTIPIAIQERRNIFGAAPTGSGKTLAFALPILTNLSKNQDLQQEDRKSQLGALILSPTRELAIQIKKHIDQVSPSTIRIGLLVGGLAIQKQERILSKFEPEIVVGTPGRIWEILTNGNVPYFSNETISKVRHLVIDEADRMIEQGHFRELRDLIEIINANDNETDKLRRQIFIFSATLTMLQNSRIKLRKSQPASDDQTDLIELLKIDRQNLSIVDLTEAGRQSQPSSDRLTEKIIRCLRQEKDLYLYHFVLENPGRSLVFCNSIDCIRRLLNIFRFLQIDPLSLHSGMPQKRRLLTLERFQSRQIAMLLTTDVAARGLDLPQVDHVIHYQLPGDIKTYVHRTGRTARASNRGFNLILADPKEEAWQFRTFKKRLPLDQIAEYLVEDSRQLKKLKERLRLALVCDQLEHRLRKQRTQKEWLRSTAEACDLINSDESDEFSSDQEEKSDRLIELKQQQRQLACYQKQLDQLLKQPFKRKLAIINQTINQLHN